MVGSGRTGTTRNVAEYGEQICILPVDRPTSRSGPYAAMKGRAWRAGQRPLNTHGGFTISRTICCWISALAYARGSSYRRGNRRGPRYLGSTSSGLLPEKPKSSAQKAYGFVNPVPMNTSRMGKQQLTYGGLPLPIIRLYCGTELYRDEALNEKVTAYRQKLQT